MDKKLKSLTALAALMTLTLAGVAPRAQETSVPAHLERLRNDGFIKFEALPELSQTVIGVVGDSLACGANADMQLSGILAAGQARTETDMWAQLGAMVGETWTADKWRDPLRIFKIPSATPVPFGERMEFLGTDVVDCEECSFGAQVADRLSLPRANVFIAAEDGRKVSRTAEQLQKLAATLQVLPQLILISWNANDLCHLDNRQRSAGEIYELYRAEFHARMKEGLDAARPNPQGTRIAVIASLDIMNALRNERVLAKTIQTTEGRYTCRQVRQQAAGGFNALTNQMCGNILNIDIDTEQNLVSLLEQQHLAIVRAQRDVTAALSSEYAGKFQFQFIDSIRQIEFTENDISSDCFHPSVHGHSKIADAIFRSLR